MRSSVEMLVETLDAGSLPLFRALSVAAEHERGGAARLRDLGRHAATEGVRCQRGGARRQHRRQAHASTCGCDVGDGQGRRFNAGVVRHHRGIVERLSVPPRVVIFGAGHLACSPLHVCKIIGFRVTIYDDRSDYANRQRFADADEVIVGRLRKRP